MRDFFTDIDWSRWSETIWTSGVRVIVIIVATYVALHIIQQVLKPAFRTAAAAQMGGQPAVEIGKRVDTLTHVAYRTI